VIGIGIVKLTVAPSPGSTERSTIVLKDVLHVPASMCNVLGPHLAQNGEYTVSFGDFDDNKGGILNREGQNIAYFVKRDSLFALGVFASAGQTLYPTEFRSDESYAINCYWPDAEKQKWAEYKAQQTAGESELLCPDWVFDHIFNVQ
jgi:hypothetical protein